MNHISEGINQLRKAQEALGLAQIYLSNDAIVVQEDTAESMIFDAIDRVNEALNLFNTSKPKKA